MKIAVSGKGGVGKTTFSALLCNEYEKEGTVVLAVDADPDANLSNTLGFKDDNAPTPISSLKKLIEERTGAQQGAWGGYFKLNPQVNDIPDKFCVRRGSLSLMLLGSVEKAGHGCICPESAFLKALMTHMVFNEKQHLIMDMEAGLEHLGRGTSSAVDALLVIVRPDMKSLETAQRIVPLYEDLKIPRLFYVGNEAETEDDIRFLKDNLIDYPLLGVIPSSMEIRKSGREGRPPFDDPRVNEEMKKIRERLEKEVSVSK